MDDSPYSNREIDEKWDNIANALSRIEIQTTTTNGRVTKLERNVEIDKAVHDAQLKLIKNFLYVLSSTMVFILGSIVVPIITTWMQTHGV